MRIVAGTLKGRIIEAPQGDGTRPTVDRVREALFSSLFSLRGGFEDAVVLDAFAGSGALGIEALSRGATRAVFYERDAKAAAVLKRNIASCKLDATQAQIVQRDIVKAPPSGQVPVFDLVFLDPPYAYDPVGVLAMVRLLARGGAVSPEAIVVYEHALPSREEVARAAENAAFKLVSSKKYGKTGITILTCETGE